VSTPADTLDDVRANHRLRFHRSVIAAGCLAAFASAGCAAPRDTSESSGQLAGKQADFEIVLERVRSEHAVPALAAAFVRGGEITAGAVGLGRIDRTDRVKRDDRFHVGSVSKPISATVIATLVEDGLLRWDTTVAEVLGGSSVTIRDEYRRVTLEQLLSHRAGILPWEEDEEIARAPKTTGTPAQQRRAAALWLLRQPPVAKPGTEHVYSNAGYLVAASMAEEKTGAAWEDLVQERLANPLELKTLGVGWPARTDPAQPWGHQADHGGFLPHPPDDPYQLGPWLVPAGDLHMSITDLARFARLHLERLMGKPALLKPETFQKLHRPFGDYALGWNVKETADHHLGGAGTFIAAIWVSVPRKVAIVMASNADADEGIVSDGINQILKLFEVPRP